MTISSASGSGLAASESGLVLITSSTFSAAASVSVNSCFTSTFANYRITLNLTAMSSDLAIFMRLRAAGSDDTSASYRSQSLYATSATVTAVQNQNSCGSTQWNLYGTGESTDPTAHQIAFDLFSPQAAAWTTLAYSPMIYASDQNTYAGVIGNAYFGTTSFDGFTLITSTGTMSGKLRVYGYRNS